MAECPRGERILPPREVARLSDVSCNGKDSGSVGRRALCFEEIDVPLLDDETWPKRLDCSRKPEIRASPRFYRYCSTCTPSTFFFDDTEREERERESEREKKRTSFKRFEGFLCGFLSLSDHFSFVCAGELLALKRIVSCETLIAQREDAFWKMYKISSLSFEKN